MRLRPLLMFLPLLTLSACAAQGLGPVVDLGTLAAPDPLPQPSRSLPPPIPGPTPGTGMWRAWVPPQVAANGDTVEGHFMVISTTPPPLETVEPSAPIPRAPKVHVSAKPKPVAPPPAAAPQPITGLGLPGGRAPIPPFAIPTLGGQ